MLALLLVFELEVVVVVGAVGKLIVGVGGDGALIPIVLNTSYAFV